MSRIRKLKDILGNEIRISGEPYSECHLTYTQFAAVIAQPTYIVEEKGKALHYLRNIDEDVNLLVTARTDRDFYTVEYCIVNPSKDQIISLLKKGNLLTF